MPFSHESLDVYQRALSFNATVIPWIGHWDARHAICDHLERAAESILENIAAASASRSAMKVADLDFAIGSTLECAACLDIAIIKRLASMESMPAEKRRLAELMRMLVGLRRSWSAGFVREDTADYRARDEENGEEHGHACNQEEGQKPFHHEKLHVYRVGLEIIGAVSASGDVRTLPDKVFRRLDSLLSSIVLNIAEGNGRLSAAEQNRFLATSHEATIKAAAKLDLCVVQGVLPEPEVARWKALLERVASMTAAMMR